MHSGGTDRSLCSMTMAEVLADICSSGRQCPLEATGIGDCPFSGRRCGMVTGDDWSAHLKYGPDRDAVRAYIHRLVDQMECAN